MAIKLKQTSPAAKYILGSLWLASLISANPVCILFQSKTVVGLPSSCNKTHHFARIVIELLPSRHKNIDGMRE